MIWHINETGTTATAAIAVADTLQRIEINGSQGFQTVAYWHSMGLPDFNLCGVAREAGANTALIPVSLPHSGVVSRVSFTISAYASNYRIRTFRWRITDGRIDQGQGQTLGQGEFTCPFGSHSVTVDCPVSVPQIFYIYLEPWTNEYGNIHITGTVYVTISMAAGAMGALSATPYIYHNGSFRSATAKVYKDGWKTGG